MPHEFHDVRDQAQHIFSQAGDDIFDNFAVFVVVRQPDVQHQQIVQEKLLVFRKVIFVFFPPKVGPVPVRPHARLELDEGCASGILVYFEVADDGQKFMDIA